MKRGGSSLWSLWAKALEGPLRTTYRTKEKLPAGNRQGVGWSGEGDQGAGVPSTVIPVQVNTRFSLTVPALT